MDEEQPPGPPPARELPLWRRLGRALTRAVWPIAGAKNDPWLADDQDRDPDMARPELPPEPADPRDLPEPPEPPKRPSA
jgi:hypothetical protein